MVEVRIDSHENLTGSLILELRIASNALEGGVPSHRARHIGGLAQPEITLLQDLELLFEEEDWAVLSLRCAIGAPHPYIIVLWQTLQ